jgi:tungstate transport system ATP-binding protein
MTERTLLVVNDLAKRHSDDFLLRVPKLEVVRGETLCLVGPTGSGKTTLLRLLGGIDADSSGDILLDGQRLAPASTPIELQRRITLVFQEPQLLSGSVRSNVARGIRFRGATNDSAARVTLLMEQLGLDSIARQSAATLSGGQRQLVSIARALAVEPCVLLLDEPTANLDPARVGLVEETIRCDQQDRGTTVVWATHNLFQARRVSNRTAFVLDGEVIEVSPTGEFFEKPQDSRTASFVRGDMVY